MKQKPGEVIIKVRLKLQYLYSTQILHEVIIKVRLKLQYLYSKQILQEKPLTVTVQK